MYADDILKNWFKEKENIIKKTISFFPKQRQIWVCKLGINIGREQNGSIINFSRPVLIYKQFGDNSLILPLTSKLKNSEFRYLFVNSLDLGLAQETEVIIDQIK